MIDWRHALIERIAEDDGLVAGLPSDAAEVLRRYCLSRVTAVSAHSDAAAAEAWTDELVANCRILTDVLNGLSAGRQERWLAARLGKVVEDGPEALATLQDERPLADRLTAVLACLREPQLT